MSRVYLGLGSNLGDRLQNITTAIAKLSSLGKLKSYSSIWETSPWGFAQQGDFLNCVVLIETTLLPPKLIEEISKIEHSMGRKREKKFGPRTVDIDILFYDALSINTPLKGNPDRHLPITSGLRTLLPRDNKSNLNLIIPHRLLHRRKFVLLPLSEIAPYLIHPVLKKPISELLKELNSREICRIFVLADKFSSSFSVRANTL